MGIFNHKKTDKLSDEEKTQYENELDRRGTNVSSFEDDPMLNLEPTFADDYQQQKINQDMQKNYGGASKSTNPLASIISNHREKHPSTAASSSASKIPGPLGDIIGAARKKSEEMAQDVADRDPVIAKLQKIEKMLRTGGTDPSLYTDTSKSQVGYYSQRAKDFAEQNILKKVESDQERIARMAQETKERGANTNYTPNIADRTAEIRATVEMTRNKGPRQHNELESDARLRARALLSESARNNAVSSENVFGIAAQQRYVAEKEKREEKLNVGAIVGNVHQRPMTPERIAELEAKIQRKIEKIQAHKLALAKKESKVMRILLETDVKNSSKKISTILEQRTVDLDNEVKRLENHEKELEKTISDLRGMILPRSRKNKNKG